MKRIFIIAALILCICSNVCAADLSNMKIDENGFTITVSGNVDGEATDKKVNMLFVLPATSSVIHIADTEWTEDENRNKSFSFEPFDMLADASSGSYEFRVKLNESGEYTTIPFSYVSATEKETIVKNIDDAAKSGLNSLIKTTASRIGINTELYSALNDTDMVDEIISDLDLSFVANDVESLASAIGLLNSELTKATICRAIIESKDSSKTLEYINDNSAFFEIDMTNYYAKLSESDKSEVLLNLSKAEDATTAEIKKTFDKEVLYKYLAGCMWYEVEDVLAEYNEYLELDTTYFDELSSSKKDDVYKELAGVVYNDVATIEYNFFEASKSIFSQNTGLSGGSSGSGGGGYAGGGYTIVKDADKESQESVEKSETAKLPFNDIENYDWAKEAIIYMAQSGIVEGKENEKFYPADSITRAEFVKMIVSGFGIKSEVTSTDFEDTKGSWADKYVATAKENNLVYGFNEKIFGMNDKITRQDMAVIIYRAAELLNISLDETKSFKNYVDSAEITGYAADAVEKMSKAGIINGLGDGRFAPKNNATRAEAAKMIYNVLKIYKGI